MWVVDVDDHVGLSYKRLGELYPHGLPVQFGSVSKNFFINQNSLSHLKGCPIRVGWGFFTNRNRLQDFRFCPHTIGDSWMLGLHAFGGDGEGLQRLLRFLPHSMPGHLMFQQDLLAKIKASSHADHLQSHESLGGPASLCNAQHPYPTLAVLKARRDQLFRVPA